MNSLKWTIKSWKVSEGFQVFFNIITCVLYTIHLKNFTIVRVSFKMFLSLTSLFGMLIGRSGKAALYEQSN